MSADDFTFSPTSSELSQTTPMPGTEVKDPTIVFIFTMSNWTNVISALSKLDLVDIAPTVATQFFVDFSPDVNGYVLILTKSKWTTVPPETKKKFMCISRRIKEEMEGPLMTNQRELYDNSDIFELLMGGPPETPQTSQTTQTSAEMQRSPSFVDPLEPIPEYAEI